MNDFRGRKLKSWRLKPFFFICFQDKPGFSLDLYYTAMYLPPSSPDGTEGTSVVELTSNKGKQTTKLYGCIVKNDENLRTFIEKDINPSADREKFETAKYCFYTCDKFQEEGICTITAVICHRFNNAKPKKSCEMNLPPDNLVRVQNQHILLPCDFRNFNDSKFLKTYHKKIRVSQSFNPTESNILHLLSYKVEKKTPIFIPVEIKQSQQMSAEPASGQSSLLVMDHEKFKKLEETGPVLLKDNKTVIGSFEKKDTEFISISIFGNPDTKTEIYSSSRNESREVESEHKPKATSNSEKVVKVQSHANKLPKELSEEKDVVENEKCDAQDMTVEDAKLSQQNEMTTQNLECHSLQPENGDDKFPEDHTDSKNNFKCFTSSSDESNNHVSQFDDFKNYCKTGQQDSGASNSAADSFEEKIHQQAITKNTNFESDTVRLPPEKDQGSSFGEKAPIQVTSESSIKDLDHLQAIQATLSNKEYSICDNLGWRRNKEKYRRFLLYVANNAAGNWQEIGGQLRVANTKLDSLTVDYGNDGIKEKAYQMLVYWRHSDKNPTLKKLLLALIDTGLVDVAYQISATDMLKDSRNHGGKPVTEDLLNKITNDVRDVWKFLGRYLAIDESDINSIKMDNRDNAREQARQMFVKWKQSNGRRATTGLLINALEDVGKQNVAAEVKVWESQ